MNDGIGSASWLEIAYTGLGLIALWANLIGVREALLDRHALRLRPDFRRRGPRDIVVRGSIRREVIRLGLLALFTALGTVAMFTPPPVRSPNQMASVIFSVVFIVMEIAIAYDTVQERVDRHEINDRLDQARARMRTEERIAAVEWADGPREKLP